MTARSATGAGGRREGRAGSGERAVVVGSRGQQRAGSGARGQAVGAGQALDRRRARATGYRVQVVRSQIERAASRSRAAQSARCPLHTAGYVHLRHCSVAGGWSPCRAGASSQHAGPS